MVPRRSWETEQENLLVLAGEALLIVEGQERPLKQWDFVHRPPETRPSPAPTRRRAATGGYDPDSGPTTTPVTGDTRDTCWSSTGASAAHPAGRPQAGESDSLMACDPVVSGVGAEYPLGE